MESIGAGLQYKVYNLENDLVFKKPTTPEEKEEWFGKNASFDKEEIATKIKSAEADTVQSIQTLQKMLTKEGYVLCGNPTFLKDLEYTQDKVTPIRDYFQNHSLEDNKKIIDSYITCTLEIWKQGFADRIFNFTINNGLDKEGKVILMDLGELTFSKEKLKEIIDQKIFLKAWSYREDIQDKNLKEYFREQTTRFFTTEAVELYWKK